MDWTAFIGPGLGVAALTAIGTFAATKVKSTSEVQVASITTGPAYIAGLSAEIKDLRARQVAYEGHVETQLRRQMKHIDALEAHIWQKLPPPPPVSPDWEPFVWKGRDDES